MREEGIMDEQARAALARANEIEAVSIARIGQLIAIAQQRDPAGRPTKDAKTAQQALGSPALTSTLPSVALRRSIVPSLDTAIDEVQRTEIAYRTAVATVRVLHARKDLFEGARGAPRKRVVEDHELAPEEWKLVRELRLRKVPVSALDQLTEPELDFVATLFVDKQKDMRHRERAGAWWTLVRAGALDISSEAFNEEERAAIMAARPADEESARLAYDALCELAGRKLDLPPAFAQFVLAYAQNSSASEPVGGFEKSVERVHADQRRADAEKLLDQLGLPISELRRAFALMQSPALISYREQVESGRAAAEQRAAEYRALVDRHRPAARRALAEAHDAQRRQERELVGADELGMLDVDAALARLGAYEEELPLGNATIIRQIREGTFLADREAERRRTVDELAARLVDSPAARRKVAEMGIALPDGDEPDVRPVAPQPVAQATATPTPAVAPETDLTPTPQDPAPIDAAASEDDFGLPGDITPAAAAAYYAIARQFAVELGQWREATFAHASADRNDPDDIARLRRALEDADRRGALNDVCTRYLAIWRDQSLAAADDYLIDREARKLINEVATGHEFEDLRRSAGFPRPAR